jgi:hypothetical protein
MGYMGKLKFPAYRQAGKSQMSNYKQLPNSNFKRPKYLLWLFGI